MRKILDGQTGAKVLANQDDTAWPGGWLTLTATGTFASLAVFYSPIGQPAATTTHLAPLHTFTSAGVHSVYLGQGVLRATVDATASAVTLATS